MSDSGPRMDAEVRPGMVFAGCRVERPLGRGGMGAVFLARREADARAVVLKFLLPELAGDPRVRERFLREARAQLKAPPCPHVVQVLEVHPVERAPFLVMEYVEGRTCLQLLKVRGGRLRPLEAALVARDVARGLAAIHAQGLVHRDIKPENVIVGADGAARVLDFGVAKDVFLSGLTTPGQLLGTTYYMAPERWGDGPDDARSDLFSLGALLYHLVVGRPPFVGGTVAETAELIAAGEYARLRDAAPDAPEDLERIVAQLLMTAPADRYALAEECAHDLERVVAGRPAKLPCLVVERLPGAPAGRRVVLVPGSRWSLGGDAGCDVVLEHPSVRPRHAELRRAHDGFRLYGLKGADTLVGDAPLDQPRLLRDGEAVRLGEVLLRFQDPRRPTRAFALDLRRATAPAAALQALVERRDPRALAATLERLTPDGRAQARAEAELRAVVGPEVAAAALRAREAAAARERAGLPAILAAMAGADAGADPAAWLAWWARARAGHREQVAAPAPAPRLRVEVLAGPAHPASVAFGAEGQVLVGRDEKCHLRLRDPGAARLHATLLRLHERVVVSDGGQARGGGPAGSAPPGTLLDGRAVTAAFVAPGETLTIGGVRLVLRADEEAPAARLAGGLTVIDPESFSALEALAHPCVAAALVALQREAGAATWPAAAAAALFPDAPGAAPAFARELEALLRRRADAARPLLARLLGGEAADPAGWEALLAARAGVLPPQVAPAGWLTATV